MDEAELRQFDIHLPPVRVHYDFRPIKIRVYRNGDELDPGKEVTVTRREFKHWIIFLDALTKKLGTTTAINRLYTTTGARIDHFDELQPKGEYVAIEKGAFAHCNYGRTRKEALEKKWATNLKAEEKQPPFLNSAETMDIYLKHEGYGSYTGLPYPLDSILAKSPSTSALHIQSHLHAEKFGGSLEKLNKVGKYIWDDGGNGGEEKQKTEAIPVNSSGVIQLPKLLGLSDSSSKQTEKEASLVDITLPVIANPVQAKTKAATTIELSQPKSEENGKEERKERVLEEKETTRKRTERKEEGERRAARSTSNEIRQKRSLEEKRVEEGKPSAERQEYSQENIIVPFLVQGKSRKKVFNIPNAQPYAKNRISEYETENKKKGPGIERIFERSERRIIRELSDDRNEIYKPSRQIVASTSSYKSYLWEARRPYDPDIDY